MKSTYIRLLLLSSICFAFLACPRVTSSSTEQEIFLVRHAEKVKDGTRNPPLTAIGQQRSQNLATVLKDKQIAAVFSTPYLRTTQTGQLVADYFKLSIIEYDPNDPTIIWTWMADNPTRNALIVGHSNTTPALTNHLLGRTELEQLDESDYGKLFRLTGPANKRQLTIASF